MADSPLPPSAAAVALPSRMRDDERPGISEEEAARRLAVDGPNELPSAQPKSLTGIAADVLREPMLLLLIAAGAIYLLLGDRAEAVAMLAAGVVVGITLFQEQKTERTLYALRDLSSPRALVVRGGVTKRIAGREVVRGDTIVLQEGDRVAADAVVLSSTNLCLDESLLTGESVPVRKAADAVAYSGTLVVSGRAMARVTATGPSTELGRIGSILRSVDIGRTPLQQEVGWVVRVRP